MGTNSAEVNFVETDAESIIVDMLSEFQNRLDTVLYPGDEKRMLLQAFAYAISDAMNHINIAGRGTLLRYATGNQLDALGDLYGNERLEAEKATTIVAFTLSSTLGQDITIPAGTRVTPDGTIFFETDSAIVFEANSETLTKTVAATATDAGSSYNGFEPGQINRLVDTNPYIESVTNTVVSYGGTDTETDDEYRERLRETPFRFSVAGPANAYESIAMSVSNQIADAKAYSPSAGEVEIAIVLNDGVIPDAEAEIITEVLAACSDENVRPLTDHVSVVPATPVAISINATYYVANGDTSVAAAVLQAVEEYKSWQCEKIGRDINPDHLRELMRNAGAAMINITSPVYQKMDEGAVAQVESTVVTYGGSISV